MKKISDELKTLIITNVDVKKDLLYHVKIFGCGYFSLSNEFIEGTKDRKLAYSYVPVDLHYWELLYLIYIIEKYSNTVMLNNIEIWSN